MTETQDTLAIGVGMLSIEQAASQLPFGDGDPVLLTKRLIARGSLASARLGATVRVPMAELTAFMADHARNSAKRAALKLPDETLTPIFPLVNGPTWFGAMPGVDMVWWWRSFQAAVTAFLPARVMVREPGVVSNDPDLLLVDPPLGPGVNVVTLDVGKDFDLARVKALQAIINQPVPVASPFRNMGEILLAQRLQAVACDEENRMHQRPGVIGERGVKYFYGSEANYTEVITAAMEAMQPTAIATAQKSDGGVVVMARLNGGTMMQWAGSNPGRLTCLAF